METQDYLRELAQVNRNGFGFLLAFGVTWGVAAVVGWRLGDRAGAYAALFQGMVGVPLGLLLTWLVADGPRPTDPALGSLSVYLAAGQLLALPLAAVLVATGRHTVAVATLATMLAVHFVPYAWLYATPVYLVVGGLVAVGTAVLVATGSRRASTGPVVCALVSSTLVLGAVAALVTT